jgi:hypothetical protein
MKAHAVVFVALGMAACLLPGGCAAYQDPTTGEKAHYGCQTLKAKLDAGIPVVYAAARRATSDLHLRVTRAAHDGISGEIRAIDAQRDCVDVCLGALPEGRTVLKIRVGVFGDKNKSIVFFEQIMKNLSQAQPLAAAPVVQWEN